MKPVVYVETSVVSYYTARPSRDVLVLAHQEITRQWWPTAQERFGLAVSDLVLLEAGADDPEAASARLKAIESFRVLSANDDCDQLAEVYTQQMFLPERAARDAAHLAIASVYGVDYLVTWNCAHIANALIRRKLAEINASRGVSVPIICTPEEMPSQE